MQIDKEELPGVLEALLFATDAPLTVERLKETIDGSSAAEIREAIETLRGNYERDGRAFEVRAIAGGWQLASRAHYAVWVAKLYRGKPKPRLSRAALETLAVIAYRQPVTRAEVEAIRGVNVDGVMRTLMEKSLVTVTGRREVPGRPLTFGTTRDFLTYFGLNDLGDLPAEEELEGLFGTTPPAPADGYVAPQGPFAGGGGGDNGAGASEFVETEDDGSSPEPVPGAGGGEFTPEG